MGVRPLLIMDSGTKRRGGPGTVGYGSGKPRCRVPSGQPVADSKRPAGRGGGRALV